MASLVPPFWVLGAILVAWAWGRPGGTSEQQEGHVCFQNHMFCDFEKILVPHFESFLGSNGFVFVLFGLFLGHLSRRFVS